jgi:hypothetical protein
MLSSTIHEIAVSPAENSTTGSLGKLFAVNLALQNQQNQADADVFRKSAITACTLIDFPRKA